MDIWWKPGQPQGINSHLYKSHRTNTTCTEFAEFPHDTRNHFDSKVMRLEQASNDHAEHLAAREQNESISRPLPRKDRLLPKPWGFIMLSECQ